MLRRVKIAICLIYFTALAACLLSTLLTGKPL